MNCITCGNPLTGRQTKYCQRSCKFKNHNVKHQDYAAQQIRGRTRKVKAVELKGGCCSSCSYSKNLAALCFHHVDGKDFGLDLRSFSNNSWKKILIELERTILLCHNCHMEEHHPDLALSS